MRSEASTDADTSCSGHDCGSGQRNRFFRGKVMGAEEFSIEQDYTIGRRRLINRAVLGRGVVCGFELERAGGVSDPAGRGLAGPIRVGRGFALDGSGREVVLQAKTTIQDRNTFLLEKRDGACQVKGLRGLEPGLHVLSVHYAERRFKEAPLPEGCGCGTSEEQFVCETVLFSLTPLCGKPCPCAEGDCDKPCSCGPPDECGRGSRGRHRCLCQWTAEPCFPQEDKPLCEWHDHWVDPRDGVALACVEIPKGDRRCDPVTGWVIDDCSPRLLVKGNHLLYDLLRGCDLTRIEWTSWHEWHRRHDPVAWEEFKHQFHDDGSTKFTVRFSGPVQVDTLRPDTVVITAYTERSEKWLVGRRVPVVKLDLTPHLPDSRSLPPGTTNQLRVCVGKKWREDNVTQAGGSWLEKRSWFEIQIRGDLILDCHGQPVDADAVGTTSVPSGNGTPGGTYLSTFVVEKRTASPSKEEE